MIVRSSPIPKYADNRTCSSVSGASIICVQASVLVDGSASVSKQTERLSSAACSEDMPKHGNTRQARKNQVCNRAFAYISIHLESLFTWRNVRDLGYDDQPLHFGYRYHKATTVSRPLKEKAAFAEGSQPGAIPPVRVPQPAFARQCSLRNISRCGVKIGQ